MDEYCIGCAYRVPLGDGTYFCDYIGLQFQARSRICKPGRECTVRKPIAGTRSPLVNARKQPIRQGNKRSWDTNRAFGLYKAGLSDGQIGKILGIHKNCVFMWRKAEGLQANNQSGGDVKSRNAVLEWEKAVREGEKNGKSN